MGALLHNATILLSALLCLGCSISPTGCGRPAVRNAHLHWLLACYGWEAFNWRRLLPLRLRRQRRSGRRPPHACRPRWRRQGRGAAFTCVAAGGPPPTRGDGPSGFPRRRLGSQQPPAAGPASPVVYSGERRGWRAAIAKLTGAASKRNGACGIGRGPVG